MNKPSVPAGTLLPNDYQMGEVTSGGMSSHFDLMLRLRIMLGFVSVHHETVVFIACITCFV